MKILRVILLILFAIPVFAAEGARWSKVVSEDATATSYTSHFDVDGDGYEATYDGVGVETGGEVRGYRKWIFFNADTADTVYVDCNSTGGTQNTAVNDGTKTTSIPIPAGGAYTFLFARGSERSTCSMICTAGQTCSNVHIWTSDPVELIQ